jgi:mitochondrial fission protein ELM1
MKWQMPQNFGHVAQGDALRVDVPSLAGQPAWIISDGIAGHLALTIGVAEALGVKAQVKPVAARWPWRQLAPNGPADPLTVRPLLRQVLPEIVLGAGRQTVPVVRALHRAGAFTVLFQAPRALFRSADVVWAPAHDRLNGAHAISTLTPPHRFSPARLAELRRTLPDEIAALPSPRAALLLGGPGAGYSYDDEAIADLTGRLAALASQVGSLLITPSRRTPTALLRAAEEVTSGKPRLIWDGAGDNPYPQFLAAADLFVVTADSVNMAGEACATGRPVYVFTPSGGRAKFRRYHEALQAHGATRPLPVAGTPLSAWTYQPIQAAAQVATEIEARWRARVNNT